MPIIIFTLKKHLKRAPRDLRDMISNSDVRTEYFRTSKKI